MSANKKAELEITASASVRLLPNSTNAFKAWAKPTVVIGGHPFTTDDWRVLDGEQGIAVFPPNQQSKKNGKRYDKVETDAVVHAAIEAAVIKAYQAKISAKKA